jgi:hypothetical protein
MATAKIDAHNARVRDALILPFKRKIASLNIRADIWKNDAKPTAKNAEARNEAQARARAALTEVDTQVADLADIKFPADTKTSIVQAEMDKMKASYADIRKVLVAIAGVDAAAA